MNSSQLSQLPDQTLLGLWLDDQLSASQRAEFERRCAGQEAFAKQVEAASMLSSHASVFAEQDVPEWSAEGTFMGAEQPKWWQWQGLPAVSLATSFLALVVVLVGFAPMQSSLIEVPNAQYVKRADVDKLVAEKLAVFKQAQTQAFEEYAMTIKQQQLEMQAKRTEFLLAESRQERREDFAEWLKYVDQQRQEDQLFLARQFNQMQNELLQYPQSEQAYGNNE
jgi:hypothetical protein